jgi:hypothetical protein
MHARPLQGQGRARHRGYATTLAVPGRRVEAPAPRWRRRTVRTTSGAVPEPLFGAGGVKILALAHVLGGEGSVPSMDLPVSPHQPACMQRCAGAANGPFLF